MGWGGAVVALAVAVIYFFVVPHEAQESSGVVHAILRYGHSLVWVLLAAAGVAFALAAPKRLIGGLAWTALAVYAIFLVTLLVVGPLSG